MVVKVATFGPLLESLSASSRSELLIVDWIVSSLDPLIEEIRLSLVTLAISPCDGEMVEYRDSEMVECRDGEMMEWHVMFGIFTFDGEMVQWVFKPIGVDYKVGRLKESFEMSYKVT